MSDSLPGVGCARHTASPGRSSGRRSQLRPGASRARHRRRRATVGEKKALRHPPHLAAPCVAAGGAGCAPPRHAAPRRGVRQTARELGAHLAAGLRATPPENSNTAAELMRASPARAADRLVPAPPRSRTAAYRPAAGMIAAPAAGLERRPGGAFRRCSAGYRGEPTASTRRRGSAAGVRAAVVVLLCLGCASLAGGQTPSRLPGGGPSRHSLPCSGAFLLASTAAARTAAAACPPWRPTRRRCPSWALSRAAVGTTAWRSRATSAAATTPKLTAPATIITRQTRPTRREGLPRP